MASHLHLALSHTSLCVRSQVVSTETVFEFDTVLNLDVVAELKGEPIYDLVRLFATGNLANYLDWHKSNGAVLTQHNIDHAVLTRKMRLSTLAQLCASQKVIEFTVISQALQINAEDIEDWVIDSTLKRGGGHRKVVVP